MNLILFFASAVALAKPDLSQYKGMFFYTVRGQNVSKCKKIGAAELKELAKYKGCSEWKEYFPPLEEVHAKCEKANDTTAYIFTSGNLCDESFADMVSG